MAADALARHLKVSRGELDATARSEFLARHEDADVTVRVDRLYTEQIQRTRRGIPARAEPHTPSEGW